MFRLDVMLRFALLAGGLALARPATADEQGPEPARTLRGRERALTARDLAHPSPEVHLQILRQAGMSGAAAVRPQASRAIAARELEDGLGYHLVVRRQPLHAPLQGSALRAGVADMAVSVPLSGPVRLRTGARFDYTDSDRAEEGLDVEGMPTVGLEVHF